MKNKKASAKGKEGRERIQPQLSKFHQVSLLFIFEGPLKHILEKQGKYILIKCLAVVYHGQIVKFSSHVLEFRHSNNKKELSLDNFLHLIYILPESYFFLLGVRDFLDFLFSKLKSRKLFFFYLLFLFYFQYKHTIFDHVKLNYSRII